jgi:hypothetical protein
MESNFHSGFGSLLGAFATFSYLFLSAAGTPGLAATGKLDTAKIDQLTGRKENSMKRKACSRFERHPTTFR